LHLEEGNIVRIFREFTPNWFTVGMGTGIVALDAFLLPNGPLWLKSFGTDLWLFNIVLVGIFSVLLLGRALFDRAGFQAVMHHPVQSMFFGAIPMALTTLVNGFINMGPALLGAQSLIWARDLWVVNTLVAFASVILVPFYMFTRHQHRLDTMTAVWLMPIVPAEVVAASASSLLPHLAKSTQHLLFIGTVTLWAFSVPLAFLLLGILFLRLTLHKLPPREMAISTWISLGTLGTGVMGMVGLGTDSRMLFPGWGTTLMGAAWLTALVLWGFGIWWFVQSLLITLYYRWREPIPFNLGWWGLTFPLGVFTGGTDLLYHAFNIPVFRTLSIGFFGLLTIFWLLVAGRTLNGLIRSAIRTLSTRETPEPDEEAVS